MSDNAIATERAIFAGGCFWCMEKPFEELDGVLSVTSGYSGGSNANPTYENYSAGGHIEVVEIVYDPKIIGLEDILRLFWQEHNPTQGMRQGNDRGTQYRSAIFCSTEDQLAIAKDSKARYAQKLLAAGHPSITTEVGLRDAYYLAEDYHQQYLYKNPNGYCGLAGCGVSF